MKKYGLVVIGGGLSGIGAAIAASREGLSVLLLERSGSFGGAIANNMIYPFMPYWTLNEEGNKKYLSRGIFEELIKRINAADAKSTDHRYNSEIVKFVLDGMVTDEDNIDILFHSTVYALDSSDGEIKSLSVSAGAKKFEVAGDFYIDATGDGNFFAMAGCDHQVGRDSDGFCQPMTTCFRVACVDVDQFCKDKAHLNELYLEEYNRGNLRNPRNNILSFPGYAEGIVHFNTTRVIKHDPTNVFDVSRAEIEARRQIVELMEFLRKNTSSFENAYVVSVANEIGVRESRKLRGEHILTVEELKNTVDFEDKIAAGNYDIDIHDPTGGGTSHYYFPNGTYYHIPYRSLLPKEYKNLLVAGRCISATHEAQASIRIMPICTCIGEAAGTAIAVAKHSGANTHTVDVKKVQEVLTGNGAMI